MARRRRTAEEIVAEPRQVDVPTAQGRLAAEVLGVTKVSSAMDCSTVRSSHSLAKAEVVIEAWQRRYDAVRPRSTLGYRRPAPQAVGWPGLAWPPSSPVTGQGAHVVHH